MSSALKPHFPRKKRHADPWRYGERYRLVVGPDGEEDSEVVPLRKRDLLFPEEGDRPVLTMGHTLDVHYLASVLNRRGKNRRRALVLAEHRIDFGIPEIKPLGPDVILLDGVGVWDIDRGTLPVALFRARPLSGDRSDLAGHAENDLGIKRDLYFRCGVLEYGIVDRPGKRRKKSAVLGYRAGQAGYEETASDDEDRVWLESVGVWLGVADGRAVCWDKRGKRIPSPEEERALAVQSRDKAIGARKTAERRAEAETKERKKLEARLKELEAELRKGCAAKDQ